MHELFLEGNHRTNKVMQLLLLLRTVPKVAEAMSLSKSRVYGLLYKHERIQRGRFFKSGPVLVGAYKGALNSNWKQIEAHSVNSVEPDETLPEFFQTFEELVSSTGYNVIFSAPCFVFLYRQTRFPISQPETLPYGGAKSRPFTKKPKVVKPPSLPPVKLKFEEVYPSNPKSDRRPFEDPTLGMPYGERIKVLASCVSFDAQGFGPIVPSYYLPGEKYKLVLLNDNDHSRQGSD